MELISLTTAATAIATIFFTKVIEKPGENLGQEVWDKTQNLIGRLKGKSDKIAGLLEEDRQQSVNYGEAVLELKALADKNPELAKAIKEVEAEAEASKETNPKFKEQLHKVKKEADKFKEKQLNIQDLNKLAEKIGKIGVINYRSKIKKQVIKQKI
jgi:methyl-accepting chemotaxis protein